MNKKIEILMSARSTEAEAKRHLKAGAVIYTLDEKADYIENCIGCGMDEEEAEDEWNRLEETEHDGVKYKILYVL